MYPRFVDNGKLAVLTSARGKSGFPPKCKTSTGNKFDFRSLSPSQKSALLTVPKWRMPIPPGICHLVGPSCGEFVRKPLRKAPSARGCKLGIYQLF